LYQRQLLSWKSRKPIPLYQHQLSWESRNLRTLIPTITPLMRIEKSSYSSSHNHRKTKGKIRKTHFTNTCEMGFGK
jgi:hypothetical protein